MRLVSPQVQDRATPTPFSRSRSVAIRCLFASSFALAGLILMPGSALASCPTARAFCASSADGSTVVFTTNRRLVAADTDSSVDVYERSAGTDMLISRGSINGNGPHDATYIDASSDLSKIAFATDEQLSSADTDSSQDLYVRDTATNTTALASLGPDGGNGPFDVFGGDLSADGTKAFFATHEALVGTDADSGSSDVYEHDIGSDTTSLISQGGNGSFDASLVGIANDGTKAFFTTAESLVAGDTDSDHVDVYERNTDSSTTTLVSQGGNGSFDVFFPASTSDGSRVLFETYESLDPADTDSSADIYQRNTVGGTTTLVSQAPVAGDFNGAFDATLWSYSSDGSKVFFTTDEQMLPGDTDSSTDVYERDVGGGSTSWISQGAINGNGAFPVNSAFVTPDGSKAYFTTAEQLVSADTDASVDVYERQPGAGMTTLVSQGAINGNGAFDATLSGFSTDGAKVFFESAEQLVSADTDGPYTDVYERNTASNTTALVSQGPLNSNDADNDYFVGSSADGSAAFFQTYAKLVGSDDDAPERKSDIYERSGGSTSLLTGINDTTPPETTIASGPSGPTRDTTPTFAFTSSEPGSTFACKVDEGSFAACTTPRTLGALADGTHVFKVRATDRSGNTDPTPASRTFTVDTAAPDTTITSAAISSARHRATFGFTSTEPGTFQCKLDSAASFTACGSPRTYTGLGTGFHAFKVRARDAAGNIDPTPATKQFHIG
jgi:hypothetical protein